MAIGRFGRLLPALVADRVQPTDYPAFTVPYMRKPNCDVDIVRHGSLKKLLG